MGVQPRGKKKSEMEELREQVRGMQMEIEELKRATQAGTEDGCSDAGSGTAAPAASKRQKAATHRPARRRSPPSESDDDEEIPE